MNCSQNLIEQLKVKLNTRKNVEIARFLNVSRESVQSWMCNRASMGWEHVFAAIDFLGLDEQSVVFEMLREKNKNYRVFKVLEDKKGLR